jgi:hypothetical protein
MDATPPKLFVSYSHDTQQHKDWVYTLATRLVSNGVDVALDQWDLTLGSDLSLFMEQGLSKAKRVLAICTDAYVQKANAGRGGVGYEKMILTAELMQDTSSDKIIPVVKSGNGLPPVPTFLSSRLFIDFREDSAFEARYAELLRDIYGQQIKPRPPLGANPFTSLPDPVSPTISFSRERYVAPALAGTVTFDYSNNSGRFVFGAGDMAFETAWSSASKTCIHVYRDPKSIRSVALASGITDISEITDAASYDTSSRTRCAYLGDVVVWQNTAGYYLAAKVHAIDKRDSVGGSYSITLEYRIAPSKSTSFAN